MELLDPLTDREREDLARMLESVALRDGLTLSHLDGLLCAVAVGPNVLPPSPWLTMLFGEEGPPFESLEDTQRCLALVMRHYNAVVRATADGTYVPLLPEKKPRGPSIADSHGQSVSSSGCRWTPLGKFSWGIGTTR